MFFFTFSGCDSNLGAHVGWLEERRIGLFLKFSSRPCSYPRALERNLLRSKRCLINCESSCTKHHSSLGKHVVSVFLPVAKGLFLKNNLKYLNTATAHDLNEERGGGRCRLLLGLMTFAIFF